jgi:hypothetical protein
MTSRIVPPSVTHAAADLITGATWNSGLATPVSFLTGVPMFAGYSKTSVSVASPANPSAGPFVSIPMDGTLADTDNGHSNVTNNTRYTCQVAGWYLVSGTIAWTVSSVGERYTQLALNGAYVVSSGAAAPATGFLTGVPMQQILVPMNVTDYVELQGAQDSGAALNTYPGVGGSQGCYLSLFWVSSL